MILPGSNLRGGSTGKIAGLVQDVLTGEAIAGANIIIEGTYSGAATDADGYYVILNVPPVSTLCKSP
ncbi:MAG: carboxypeptidase-like regulatory domain-containing protein [Candidatus Marinimicrobia bacterium]|nr:carboxypeptidase-like regulatory domain-containing protein [Candidatus Neomarinimicrobiota bacterium]